MEEPECLVQPDSICSKLDITAALRESVSFGRFVTEPLEWGKWSCFSQNRYLEEAERYSTRGSVAEKKAYFEAHYKRVAAAKKAAAQLLEQAGGAGEDGDGGGCVSPGADFDRSWQSGMEDDEALEMGEERWVWEDDGTYSVVNCTSNDTVNTQQMALQPGYEMMGAGEDGLLEELPQQKKQAGGDHCRETSEANASASHCVEEGRTGTSYSSEERANLGGPLLNLEQVVNGGGNSNQVVSNQVVEAPETEHDIAKSHNIAEMDQSSKHKLRYESSPLQENSNTQVPAWDKAESPPIIKRSVFSTKPAVSPPVSATTSQGKENNPTPANRKKSRKHTNNDKPLPFNQSPQHKGNNSTAEATRAPTPKSDKTWSPKVAFGFFRACQDLGNVRATPRKSSARGTPKADSIGADDRIRFSQAKTGQSTTKTDGRWQSIIVNRGRSSTSTSRPDNSNNVSSSPSFQTEKRKEYFQKLEEKLNAEKLERQLKAKEKAENELKLLRQSLSFKARPLPRFYDRTKQPKLL